MLVLCSNGLTSEPLLGMMRSKMDGCKTAAMVVTADHEYKEKDVHGPRCVAALEALGLTVALFDLDRQAAAQLHKRIPPVIMVAAQDQHSPGQLRNHTQILQRLAKLHGP